MADVGIHKLLTRMPCDFRTAVKLDRLQLGACFQEVKHVICDLQTSWEVELFQLVHQGTVPLGQRHHGRIGQLDAVTQVQALHVVHVLQ